MTYAPTLALVLALLLSPPAAASPAAPSAPAETHEYELVVLTYNVKALPIVNDLDRLKRIGEILRERRRAGREPDVVLLQEAFLDKAKRIRKRAGYPHEIVGVDPEPGFPFRNPTGLEILSNHPIVESWHRSFGDCAFPECFVEKSVLGATIRIPGVPVDVDIFNTHLQADSINDRVRKNQVDDLGIFFRRIGFGHRLAIFAGDFNFKPRHESYHQFLRKLPFREVGAECLGAPERCEVVVGVHGHTDETDVWKTTHDRHFYYAPRDASAAIRPVRLVRNFTEYWEGEPLSDHWGYEVHYRITW